jgi:oxygen-independent coproporphyrinogen-3 oxidase
MTHSQEAGLYVHVPFCVRKCRYCAFYSVPSLDSKARYLRALAMEIGRRAEPGLLCDSVYFGGGTPSLLAPDEVAAILQDLRASFRILDGAEITLEANPGTVSERSLAAFRAAGVNRLSLGAQSFDDADLDFLGRIHRKEDIRAGFEAARAAGFENVGLDLIYGLPGRDRAHWLRQLDGAAALRPEHLSGYALSFEEGTPLGRLEAEGRVAPPGEEDARDLFLATLRRLPELGYAFYEVSNFARTPELRSRHNLKYWTGASYLGFGPAAHSFRTPERRWNAPDLDGYLASLERGEEPPGGRESLTPAQRALERLYLGLRTVLGAELAAIERDLSPGLRESNAALVTRLASEGLAVREGDTLRLTPEGLAVADAIAPWFQLGG